MAIVYRVTNRLEMKSGSAQDAAVNVHHVISQLDGPLGLTEMTEILTKFETFYKDSVGPYLSASVVRNANVHSLTIARLDTNEGGVADDTLTPPLLVRNYQITGTAPSTSLPPECAIAVSHRGMIEGAPEESGNTRPRSRRRGRFYVGPLANNAAITSSGSGVAEVAGGCINQLLAGFETLCESLAAESSPEERVSYGVYSPTGDTFYSVEQAHIDNAFDTIRRRGVAATSRTIMEISLAVDHQGDVTEAGV